MEKELECVKEQCELNWHSSRYLFTTFLMTLDSDSMIPGVLDAFWIRSVCERWRRK